jgi:cytochrome c-type biogenesis protein CcmH
MSASDSLVRDERSRHSAAAWRTTWSLLAAVVVLVVALAMARQNDTANDDLASRSRAMAATLRCPSCRGQSVVDSDAPAAVAIRAQIDRWVTEGVAESTIRDRLVDRYGDAILLLPPPTGAGLVLRLVPVAVLLVSCGVLGLAATSSRRRATRRATSADRRLVADARRARVAP